MPISAVVVYFNLQGDCFGLLPSVHLLDQVLSLFKNWGFLFLTYSHYFRIICSYVVVALAKVLVTPIPLVLLSTVRTQQMLASTISNCLNALFIKNENLYNLQKKNTIYTKQCTRLPRRFKLYSQLHHVETLIKLQETENEKSRTTLPSYDP